MTIFKATSYRTENGQICNLINMLITIRTLAGV